MSRYEKLNEVLESGIVAVIRAPSGELLVDVAEALLAGGITVMEITFTVPNAAQILQQMVDRVGDQALVGAGTVIDSETAQTALSHGAEFLVSPATNLDVIQIAHDADKLVMPGALTPTEILAAWDAKADIIKIFPSDINGPAYLKALRGPLPQVLMMPTGGVNLETAADFLRAGACALGIGGSLVEKEAVASGDLNRIESLARQYVQIVRETRAAMSAEA